MSWKPDDEYGLPSSEKVSKVMDEIGVNERLVTKGRKIFERMETMEAIASPFINTYLSKVFRFGSTTEGSSTVGLNSDIDILYVYNDLNVIQSMTDMKPDANNFLMLQNEDISPGYCHLQYVEPEPSISHVKPDKPSMKHFEEYFVYEQGQILLNNSALTAHADQCSGTTQCGPAFSQAETPGFTALDEVISYYCESQPLQATSWLQNLKKSTWPSKHFKEKCLKAGCFVVPVGSKLSKRPEIEWRVSTCLQERYLMFSLNITQLRCYVLMKIILKAYIKPYIEDILTSFMCKNVLFYHIAAASHDCQVVTLLDCLLICLRMLKECVRQRNCPHFIIPENNLLAGKMTDKDRGLILDKFDRLMKDNDARFLFNIEIDSIDLRLRLKYNIPIKDLPDFPSPEYISMKHSGLLMRSLVRCQTVLFRVIMSNISECNESLDKSLLCIQRLNIWTGKYFPAMSSTLGSLITCSNMKSQANTTIPENALRYLVSGTQSDTLSGRMKLASVFYCNGDLRSTENVLKGSLENNDFTKVQTVCGCYINCESPTRLKHEFMKTCDEQNELQTKNLVAYCTVFLPCEINCIPHELGYELWRQCSGENIKRLWTDMKGDESWMNLIVADSLPFLYYLQYKVYGKLQRKPEQQQALNNLIKSIDSRSGQFHHKETSLNLLGQCLEQEQRDSEALGCYISSIKHRPTKNAARLLMCLQLFRMRKK